MYYFYLFKCKDKSLYSGITNDILKREKAHNSGKGSKYVRAHGGGKIVYSEKFRTINKALKREAEVKRFSRQEKLDLIASNNLSRPPKADTLPKLGEGKNGRIMKFNSTNKNFDNEYPKLVRDNIPEIVFQKTRKVVRQKVLKNDSKYLIFLFKKVVEEARELEYSLKHGNTEEEIADIMEILDAIVKIKDFKWQKIKSLQKEKRKKNGGFEKRILMLKK